METRRRMTRREFKRGLKQFRRTSQEYHEHHIPSGYMLRLSDGCHYLRIKAGAYWLFDKIASFQHDDRIQLHPFQIWQLKIISTYWLLECTNADFQVMLTTKIEHAQFPSDDFEIIVVEGTALLLSEYRSAIQPKLKQCTRN